MSFVCAPYLQPSLSEHDPCESAWDCLPGYVCLDGSLDPDCAGERCCFDYCNLLLGAGCEGQDCTPWFERGQAPPGLENLGVCTG